MIVESTASKWGLVEEPYRGWHSRQEVERTKPEEYAWHIGGIVRDPYS